MAEATKVTKYALGGPVSLEKLTNQSGAGAELILTTPTGKRHRYLYSTVKYSGAPTHGGVTFELDNAVNAAYDTELNKGASNARSTVHFPDGKFELGDDDAIRVTAPAGGGSLTSSITIWTEVFEV